MGINLRRLKSFTADKLWGLTIGISTDSLGVYGKVPISQTAGLSIGQVTNQAAVTTGGYMFSTTAQFNNLLAAVNQLQSWAANQGFIASP